MTWRPFRDLVLSGPLQLGDLGLRLLELHDSPRHILGRLDHAQAFAAVLRTAHVVAVARRAVADDAPVLVLADLARLAPDAQAFPLSAKTGEGIPILRGYLKERMGYQGPAEGTFTARRRHLDAIDRAAALAPATDDARAMRSRLKTLTAQYADLGACLDRLLSDIRSGKVGLKLYRQVKVYVEPGTGKLKEGLD